MAREYRDSPTRQQNRDGSDDDPRVAFAVRPGSDPLTAAFARRKFVVPWQGSRPVDDSDVDATLETIFNTPRQEPAAAYLHVPYCHNHCLFCGFFQNAWRPDASPSYVDDVLLEIDRFRDSPLVNSAPITAVYLGGGTPTALQQDDLARLIRGLSAMLPLSADCEITLEGRTHDFGIAKAVAAIEAGVNRISIGVQSFNTDVRRRIGRKKSGNEVSAFLHDLVSLQRAVIGCDLIYGLPGQDDAIWREDIETAIALDLDAVSAYALNVWPGGPLFSAVEKGKLPKPGSLPVQALAYASACELFAAAGWQHIAQSHFTNSPHERNRYNHLVKAGAACLAFGPGAGGSAHGYRWRNMLDPVRRRERISQGLPPAEGLARVSILHRAWTEVSAGLEVGDLDLAAVEAAAPGFQEAAMPLIANWSSAGLGEMTAGRFRTTRAGAFWMTMLVNGLHAVLDRLPHPGPTDSQALQ
ncbi:MAG: heme anaerobic degradation radical SAM methyltransferase ChuW/HutW [Bradyrhizobiaceae bacterium]|nr:heme anaerobic degradation radical SAM methyltransferase ChuW/HutW [Bradyrhizobiaceae bacterium]